MEKEYRNVTVTVDEEYNLISIKDGISLLKLYRIKTEDEKEYLKDRYTVIAHFRLVFCMLALSTPAAYFGIRQLRGEFVLSSFLQNPLHEGGMTLLSILLYFLGAAFCYWVEIVLIGLAIRLFHLEKAAEEDKPLKFILIAVVVLIALLLLTLIPVGEAYY